MKPQDPWPTPWLAGHRMPCPSCDERKGGDCEQCNGRGFVAKPVQTIINETLRESAQGRNPA